MTPAVLYCPGQFKRVIEQPTFHADVLPTILSYLEAKLSDPEAIDGLSLTQATEQELVTRRFCVRNYLGEDYGLIGPWTKDPAKPFAYRFTASIKTEAAAPLNEIDELGRETNVQNREKQQSEVTRWKSQLYRKSSGTRSDAK